MTNDESQMTKEVESTNDEGPAANRKRRSDFGIRHSLDIPVSTFVILPLGGLGTQ